MKKLYVVIVVLLAVGGRYAFKTFKTPAVTTETQLTGEVLTGSELTGEELTGEELTGEEIILTPSTMEEFTGEFDAEEVVTVPGSEDVNTKSGVIAKYQQLLDERKSKPVDETKLTEDDIDFLEDTIDFFQDIFNKE